MVADTLYATGTIVTKNAENSLSLNEVNVQLIPESVQMVTPDTTYNHTTDIMGLSPFSVIAYIDSTTGITQPSPIDNTKVFVYDSKLNIEPPQEITNGEVSIYSINGQLVNTYDINKEKLTIPLDNLSNAPYIYLVETLLAVIKS